VRLLVQRSKKSSVSVNGKIVGKIDCGLVVLVGFCIYDTEKDIDYLINKLINLRIFDDENHIMNKSILDFSFSILSISQFTLYADTKKGNRPSYNKAMDFNNASLMYDLFNKKLKKYVSVETGIFGCDMEVSITNDGPVTILLESE
jgi:D-tyrosyl-tRNA(Tyr) deacylase